MASKKKIHFNELRLLPPAEINLETPGILRQLAMAFSYLRELNGLCVSLPDPQLLINTSVPQESKDSSAIENIVTHIYYLIYIHYLSCSNMNIKTRLEKSM